MSRDIFKKSRLLRAQSKLTLNVSRDGACTTSLGILCQCFTTLIVKKNLPYIQSKSTLFQFKDIAPCPVATGPAKKFVPIFPVGSL